MQTCALSARPEGHAAVLERRPMFRAPEKYRDVDQIDPGLRTVVQQLLRGDRPWPLFVHGQQGSGKSCAGLCLIDAAGGWFMTLPDLCSMLIAAGKGELQWQAGHKRTVKDIWSSWSAANVVVLDEVGTRQTVSDFQYETFRRAIDEREGKPAVFIANVDLSAIGRLFDARIASRLSAGTIVQTEGDRRMRKLRLAE